MPEFGGIEAGGTKFVCAAGSGPDELYAVAQIPTTSPGETLSRVVDFFAAQGALRSLAAVGIASFGPIDRRPGSASYGRITSTPKPGWAGMDIAGTVSRALGVPVAFDTDTNGAALAEARWGAARDLTDFVYVTVGTGIGAGMLVNGSLVHGLLHPEFGHIRVPHDWAEDPFPGNCPFHGDCLEGLASGPALARRWRTAPETLPSDHPAWTIEARYLALALANLVCTLAPQRILLGGGVMQSAQLWPLVRRGVQDALAGYLRLDELCEGLDGFIAPPALGERAGVLGALALAESLYCAGL